jgi:hypothetical protein
MSKALRGILLGTIWVALFLASGPHPVPAQESEESAWLKSGDPCRPTKQHIKQLEAVGGAKVDYIKCRPVRISLTWDFDETYHHHSNLGDDRFGVGLTVSFPGYIQIAYNQMNRRQVDDVAIRGPAPCCPGEAEFLPTRLEASILGAAPGARGDKLKFFQAGAPEITYRRAAAGGLSLVWRRDGLNNQLGIVGPRFGLAKDVIPKPYQWKFAPTVMQSDEYRVKKVRDESPSWDEIRPFFDKEDVWRREYPLDDRQNLPGTAEFYAIHGRVAVQVDFAALEREEWLVTVEGPGTKPRSRFGRIRGAGQISPGVDARRRIRLAARGPVCPDPAQGCPVILGGRHHRVHPDAPPPRGAVRRVPLSAGPGVRGAKRYRGDGAFGLPLPPRPAPGAVRQAGLAGLSVSGLRALHPPEILGGQDGPTEKVRDVGIYQASQRGIHSLEGWGGPNGRDSGLADLPDHRPEA